MVRLTLIARLTDGLPLAEGLDTDKDVEVDSYKSQAKVRAVARIPSSAWRAYRRNQILDRHNACQAPMGFRAGLKIRASESCDEPRFFQLTVPPNPMPCARRASSSSFPCSRSRRSRTRAFR